MYRQLKSLKNLADVSVLASIIINIILVIEKLGYHIAFHGKVLNLAKHFPIEEYIRFSIIFLFMLILGLFNNFKPFNVQYNREEKESVKTKKMKYYGTAFIIYPVFALVILKNLRFAAASLIVAGLYITDILYTDKLEKLSSNDCQRQWHEVMNTSSNNIAETKLSWRYKLWFQPLEKIPFKKRHLSPITVVVTFILLGFIVSSPFSIVTPFIYIFMFRYTAYIVEYILGLYTSITGECTGIVEQHTNRHPADIYWKIYITDFQNKRELVYTSHEYPGFSEGQDVRVIHGIFSKYVPDID